MPNEKVNVLVLCGSLRKRSFNRIVVNALPKLAPSNMTLIDAPPFTEFPHYNADLEEANGIPEPVQRLADAIRAADGVIFVTPEYNFSIPGALKNAIDWVSRTENQPFAGKPIAIVTASRGPRGGSRVQYHIRQAMVFLDALVLNKPEVFIGDSPAKMNEETGEVVDPVTREFVQKLLAAFAEFILWVCGKK